MSERSWGRTVSKMAKLQQFPDLCVVVLLLVSWCARYSGREKGNLREEIERSQVLIAHPETHDYVGRWSCV